MKVCISILFMLFTINQGFSQYVIENEELPQAKDNGNENSTLYTKNFKFKDGAYRTYSEFRCNSPTLFYRYREDAKKDSLVLNNSKDTNTVLYSIDDNLSNKLKKKKVWGYCKEGVIYVLSQNDFSNEFLILDIFGGIMLTSSEIKVYSDGVNLNATVGTKGVTTTATITPGYTTKKVKLRLIDGETGKVSLYNVTSFMKGLKRDKKLFNEYSKIKSPKKRKDMMFIYLAKFNKKHPYYILKKSNK